MAALIVGRCALDAPGLAIPRAEPHIVVRFGPKATHGLDLHVMGARQRARRKTLRRGQRVVMVRLQLGMHQEIFGVPPSALAEQIVPLEDLWGPAAQRMAEQLAEAKDLRLAAALLEEAIAGRLASLQAPRGHTRLALEAAARLATLRVEEVADALGVSTRNLRRVFRDVVGMSPKEYARLARFHLALRRARASRDVDWADVAAATGYYDQSHLIAEFHDLAGVTPRALVHELRGSTAEPAEPAASSATPGLPPAASGSALRAAVASSRSRA